MGALAGPCEPPGHGGFLNGSGITLGLRVAPAKLRAAMRRGGGGGSGGGGDDDDDADDDDGVTMTMTMAMTMTMFFGSRTPHQ